MAVEYYTPSKDELLAAMRVEFAFLVSEYGYSELTNRPEKYVNPYSVLYRKAPIEVLVEGISYGVGTNIEFRIRDKIADPPENQFSLGWITRIRCLDAQKWEFPDQRGQLVQLPKMAKVLRAVAADLLRGDLSIVPAVRAAISEAHAKAKVADKINKFQRAEIRSQEAFRRRDYASVISELEPHRDILNRSSRMRLEIAKSKADEKK